MNPNLLAFPVLFPLVIGVGLFWDLRKNGEHQNSIGFRLFLEAVVVVNSLSIFGLIRHYVGESVVLFRLYGNLAMQFHLDHLGVVFAALIALLWPFAMLYAFEYMEHEKRQTAFFAYYIMTYGVTAGIALSGNFATLYLFYEMLTLVTFPLVLYPLTREAVAAARKYLYYSIGGAAFAFIGMIFVLNFSVTGNSGFVAGGVIDPMIGEPYRNILLLVYVLAFFGFGVKAAVFPLHGWLPKASVAPTPVTALLHAVAVVKSGVFAIMRLTYFSFGIAFLRGTWAQYVVMAAAMITIIYGSTTAVREIHFKRRLAYSTIANLSYIIFGIAQMSPLGLAAALSHMVAHAFMKITAFFCAGAVMHRADKNYVYELDGIGRQMPVTFAAYTISGLGLMGIPMFAGFISKWNLATAGLENGKSMMASCSSLGVLSYLGVAVILYSALMTGIYMMTVVVRAYFPKIVEAAGNAVETAGGVVKAAGNAVETAGGVVKAAGDAVEAGGGAAEAAGGAAEAGDLSDASAVRLDPTWKMLLPLVLFCAVILGIGIYSAPLMRLLYAIGGEVG